MFLVLNHDASVSRRSSSPGRVRGARRCIALAAVTIAYAPLAHAYIDPGTGSLILQGLIAGIATAVAMAGVYWQRLKLFLSAMFSRFKNPGAISQKNSGDGNPDEPDAH